MVHLRVVAPHDEALAALKLLEENDVACNLVYLEGASRRPEGDVILVDIPREEASVVVGDLKELRIHEVGSISVADIEVQVSEHAEQAEKDAPGAPADAVVWEQVEARTSEETRISWTFLAFMVLAALLVAIGIFEDSTALIVGGMVVGPEFGPIAAFCVAAVELRGRLALRSLVALAVGFPVAITAVWIASLVFQAIDLAPPTFTQDDHGLAAIISDPTAFSGLVAFLAGIAGMLSLSTAKSGALMGVLISVATIPAAANIGISFSYQDWESWRGSQLQLVINVAAILVAGTVTLWFQRMLYRRRRIKHLDDEARAEAGLPVGRSASQDGVSARTPATTRPRASS